MGATSAAHLRRALGASISAFPIGLGCMAMSGAYGPSDERESIATIHAALDRGVNLIDTGDFYGSGHNEALIGRALKGRRDQVVLSVKFGGMRAPNGQWIGVDARPASVKNFLSYSLARLGVDYVDIYRPARLDPAVPIEDTVGAIAEMIAAGYVRAVGLSEVGPQTIRRAHHVHAIADVQLEYSLIARGPEAAILPVLREAGIGMTAYGVLSRGLLTGSRPTAPSDLRSQLPRLSGENLRRNQRLVDRLARIALDKGVSPAQLCIAWVLVMDRTVVPLIGARTEAQLNDALGALDVTLSRTELQDIERAVPADAVAGTRYGEAQMRLLDSERRTSGRG